MDDYYEITIIILILQNTTLRAYFLWDTLILTKIVHANVTILANNFYMTRGAISRLSKKLIAKELIESYQKEDNQKEIYFRLTNKGIDIFNTHNKVHNEILKRDRKVFDAINENDYKTIINFIDYYRNHLENELKHFNIRESDKM